MWCKGCPILKVCILMQVYHLFTHYSTRFWVVIQLCNFGCIVLLFLTCLLSCARYFGACFQSCNNSFYVIENLWYSTLFLGYNVISNVILSRFLSREKYILLGFCLDYDFLQVIVRMCLAHIPIYDLFSHQWCFDVYVGWHDFWHSCLLMLAHMKSLGFFAA